MAVIHNHRPRLQPTGDQPRAASRPLRGIWIPAHTHASGGRIPTPKAIRLFPGAHSSHRRILGLPLSSAAMTRSDSGWALCQAYPASM